VPPKKPHVRPFGEGRPRSAAGPRPARAQPHRARGRSAQPESAPPGYQEALGGVNGYEQSGCGGSGAGQLGEEAAVEAPRWGPTAS